MTWLLLWLLSALTSSVVGEFECGHNRIRETHGALRLVRDTLRYDNDGDESPSAPRARATSQATPPPVQKLRIHFDLQFIRTHPNSVSQEKKRGQERDKVDER